MLKVTVCIGSSCHLKGSRRVIEELQYLVKSKGLGDDIELSGAFCMGKCSENGVSVTVDGEYYAVDPDRITEFFDDVIQKKLNEKK